MEHNARRELNAYVFVERWTLTPAPEGQPLKAVVVIKNFGETPAYRLRISPGLVLGSEEQIPSAQSGSGSVLGALGPGATYEVTMREKVTAADMEKVSAGRLKLFVFGRVEYEDAFKNTGRWMTFRVMAAGPPAGPELWKLISCEQGNDSDPPE